MWSFQISHKFQSSSTALACCCLTCTPFVSFEKELNCQVRNNTIDSLMFMLSNVPSSSAGKGVLRMSLRWWRKILPIICQWEVKLAIAVDVKMPKFQCDGGIWHVFYSVIFVSRWQHHKKWVQRGFKKEERIQLVLTQGIPDKSSQQKTWEATKQSSVFRQNWKLFVVVGWTQKKDFVGIWIQTHLM